MRGGGVVDQTGMKAGRRGANRLRQLAATDLVALTTICRGGQVMGHGQASDAAMVLESGKKENMCPVLRWTVVVCQLAWVGG